MMYTAIFAILAVGLAAANQEYVLHTSGRGNEKLCGKYHYCIDEATCTRINVHDQSTKMCVCNNELNKRSALMPSRLISNGKLFCKHPEDKSFVIQMDPHMRNFYKHREFLSLDSPCRYRMAHLVMLPETDATAQIEVFGENVLVPGGEYYLNKVTLTLNTIIAEDMMKQTMQFYGKVSDDGINYTLIAKSIDTEGFTIGPEFNILDVERTSFNGYIMRVDKDAVNNLLKVTIPKLGVTLLFRPPSLTVDNKKLPMAPGAVFIIDHTKYHMVAEKKSDFELSSSPEGPSVEEIARQYNMPKPLIVHYMMLNNTLSSPIYNDEVCLESGRIFREECSKESVRKVMLKACTPLYTNKEFLRILTEQEVVDNYDIVQKRFFQRCEKAFCMRDIKSCTALKDDLKKEFKVPLPEEINIKCDSLVQDSLIH